MPTTPTHPQRRVRSVTAFSPFLRHLNTGTVAFVMLVALTVLTTTRAKDVETGYLQVYSATDEVDDGGVPYHAHSSYIIRTADGKLFRSVGNHISPSDEVPALVRLPAGSYIVEARSESRGLVRVNVTVKAGCRAILDLESGKIETVGHLACN